MTQLLGARNQVLMFARSVAIVYPWTVFKFFITESASSVPLNSCVSASAPRMTAAGLFIYLFLEAVHMCDMHKRCC